MARIWFISDTHFFSSSIIRYYNRPWYSSVNEKGTPVVMPRDTEKMNADMIRNWNQTVGVKDIVWHLGDFAKEEASVNMVRSVVNQLNGRINLVIGNHDTMSVRKYIQAGFNSVYDYPIVYDNKCILTHEPIKKESVPAGYSNIFGHVHNSLNYQTFTPNTACVCVERHNYSPISFEYIQREMQRQRG